MSKQEVNTNPLVAFLHERIGQALDVLNVPRAPVEHLVKKRAIFLSQYRTASAEVFSDSPLYDFASNAKGNSAWARQHGINAAEWAKLMLKDSGLIITPWQNLKRIFDETSAWLKPFGVDDQDWASAVVARPQLLYRPLKNIKEDMNQKIAWLAPFGISPRQSVTALVGHPSLIPQTVEDFTADFQLLMAAKDMFEPKEDDIQSRAMHHARSLVSNIRLIGWAESNIVLRIAAAEITGSEDIDLAGTRNGLVKRLTRLLSTTGCEPSRALSDKDATHLQNEASAYADELRSRYIEALNNGSYATPENPKITSRLLEGVSRPNQADLRVRMTAAGILTSAKITR